MQKKSNRRAAGEHMLTVLAQNVRTMRQAKGLSQEELAHEAGIHRTYVGSIERGERNATISTLELLASVLGVTVPELLSPNVTNGTSNEQGN
jgi:transcriptional regulator with XRE-family HTH domain